MDNVFRACTVLAIHTHRLQKVYIFYGVVALLGDRVGVRDWRPVLFEVYIITFNLHLQHKKL